MPFDSSWSGVGKMIKSGEINEAVCASVCDAENNSMIGVIGLIGPGTTVDQNADYRAAYSDSALSTGLESVSQKMGFAIRNKEMTRVIWGTIHSFQFNLVLVFIAFNNAAEEVMKPIKLLNEMAAVPADALAAGESAISGFSKDNLLDRFMGMAKDYMSGMRASAPRYVQIGIGKTILYKDCVIESVSIPIDKERDKDGNLLRATVNLSIKSATMLDQTDIGGMFIQKQG